MDHDQIRHFYNNVYHKHARANTRVSSHLIQLARRCNVRKNQAVLDIGCGTGEWLRVVESNGAIPFGNDISEAAIDACKRIVPRAELHCGPAEVLPWENRRFDLITCLGSLEHFLDPAAALNEMVRVAKSTAAVLLLVPNADFLTRKLGLYDGTQQADICERVRTLGEWDRLFEAAGLQVTHRWKDLHVVSRQWIMKGSWYVWPLRTIQAMMLPIWPLAWQYQVYHMCKLKNK